MSNQDTMNPFDEPKSETLDVIFAPPPTPTKSSSSSTQRHTQHNQKKQDILDEVFERFSPGDIPSQHSSMESIDNEEEGDLLNIVFGPLHNIMMGNDIGVCVGHDACKYSSSGYKRQESDHFDWVFYENNSSIKKDDIRL